VSGRRPWKLPSRTPVPAVEVDTRVERFAPLDPGTPLGFPIFPELTNPITLLMKSYSIAAIFGLFLALIALSGCKNTADGFGKDVENAGEKIQEKVD